MDRQEILNAVGLGGIFAVRMLGLFMILPVFSLYATQLPGTTPTLIGLALGAYGLTQAIFQLPFGIWSDYTSRKKVIFIGLIIFIFGSVIAALSHQIWGIIIGRAVQGAGAIGSSIIAMVGDVTAEENRTKAMAIVCIMIAVSFMLAIIIGPIVGHWVGVPGLFWLTAILAIIAIFILWKGVPKPAHQHREFQLVHLPQQISIVIRNRYVQRINMSILFSHAILTAMFIILPTVIVHKLGVSLQHQWYLYLPVLFLTLMTIRGFLKRHGSVKQERRQWIISIVMILISQFLLSAEASHVSVWLMGLALYFFFTGFTFLEALLPAILSKTVDINYRGTASGLFSTCQFLGIFLGGTIGGWLATRYHMEGLLYGNCALALLWLTFMVPLWGKVE